MLLPISLRRIRLLPHSLLDFPPTPQSQLLLFPHLFLKCPNSPSIQSIPCSKQPASPTKPPNSLWKDLFSVTNQNPLKFPAPSYLDDGTPIVQAPPEIFLRTSEMWKGYLIVNIFGTPPPSSKIFNDLNPILGKQGAITVRQFSQGSCLIFVPSLRTRQWILEVGFWSAATVAFSVVDWSPSPTFHSSTLSSAPLWLTLTSVPPQLWSFQGFALIASGIGNSLPSKRSTPPPRGDPRLPVIANLEKPLPSEVMVRDTNGSSVRVGIVYERLPSLCSTCSRYGHMPLQSKISAITAVFISHQPLSILDGTRKETESRRVDSANGPAHLSSLANNPATSSLFPATTSLSVRTTWLCVYVQKQRNEQTQNPNSTRANYQASFPALQALSARPNITKITQAITDGPLQSNLIQLNAEQILPSSQSNLRPNYSKSIKNVLPPVTTSSAVSSPPTMSDSSPTSPSSAASSLPATSNASSLPATSIPPIGQQILSQNKSVTILPTTPHSTTTNMPPPPVDSSLPTAAISNQDSRISDSDLAIHNKASSNVIRKVKAPIQQQFEEEEELNASLASSFFIGLSRPFNSM